MDKIGWLRPVSSSPFIGPPDLVFPDLTVEVFPDRHHFDPPHRIEPARVAASLRSLWARAEHA